MDSLTAVILAGGIGSRLSEETSVKPKPLIKIGEMPIIWHIMKIYSFYGVKKFVVCCGYKGELIKEFFSTYSLYHSDYTINFSSGSIETHRSVVEDWEVTLVSTGLETMTGGRLARVKDYIPNDRPFFLTYGDGVGDIDIGKLYQFHNAHGRLATLTAATAPGRFGALDIGSDSRVLTFTEKPSGASLINAGFFVLDPRVIDYIHSDLTVWEERPLKQLAQQGQLMSYQHKGFWRPMDTLKDKQDLNSLWADGKALWKTWSI